VTECFAAADIPALCFDFVDRRYEQFDPNVKDDWTCQAIVYDWPLLVPSLVMNSIRAMIFCHV